MARELDEALEELDKRIDKLKIAYERYFMGLEKFAPSRDRTELDRMIRRLGSRNIVNTAARFKMQSLKQRFVTYTHYWNRVLRSIEKGTYHREIARVQRNLKNRGVDVEGLTEARSIGELEAVLVRGFQQPDTATPQAPPPAPASANAPPPIPTDAKKKPTRAASPPDPRFRRLYDAYVSAKKKVGENTTSLTYDKVMGAVQKQIERIKKKTGARTVDFKIEIVNRKVILKAKPKM